MLANREGRFRARVLEAGTALTGPNKLATITLAFAVTEEFLNGAWGNIESEFLEITAYCYVEKRDGSLNEFQVNALREAFGWAGDDPFWFEDHLDELPECQVVLAWDEYQGTSRIKVQFINAYDSEGRAGVAHADATERREIMSRIGHKLRALSGGTAANAPKPTGKPKAAPRRAPAAAAPATKHMTVDEAWKEVDETCQLAGLDVPQTNAVWLDAMKAVSGQDDDRRVRPGEWEKIVAHVRETHEPKPDTSPVRDDEVPGGVADVPDDEIPF